MEQLTLPGILPVGYLPCSNPDLVEGYVAISEILQGKSYDFGLCREHRIALCECALDEKRMDESYKLLVEHFRNGGAVNQPIDYSPRTKTQANGHHRLVAALDAGFTHIPYHENRWGEEEDWEGVDAEKYGFRVVWGNVTEITE